MAKNRRKEAIAAAALACALGLVLAVVTLRGRGDDAPSELLSRMEIAQRGLMAAQVPSEILLAGSPYALKSAASFRAHS